MKCVYLAGPIDFGGDIKWKELLIEQIHKDMDVVFFDPALAFKIGNGQVSPEMAMYIERVNAEALAAADVVVCSLPRDVTTVGTIIEIDKCHVLKKHLVLITNVNVGKSVYLLNRVNLDTVIKLTDTSSETVAQAVADAAALLRYLE